MNIKKILYPIKPFSLNLINTDDEPINICLLSTLKNNNPHDLLIVNGIITEKDNYNVFYSDEFKIYYTKIFDRENMIKSLLLFDKNLNLFSCKNSDTTLPFCITIREISGTNDIIECNKFITDDKYNGFKAIFYNDIHTRTIFGNYTTIPFSPYNVDNFLFRIDHYREKYTIYIDGNDISVPFSENIMQDINFNNFSISDNGVMFLKLKYLP